MIRVNAKGVPGCEVLLGDQIVATSPVGFPRGMNLHHHWFSLLAIVDGARVRFLYDGREVLDATLPAPIEPGQFGIWTRDNGIRLARITLSLSNPKGEP